MPDLQISIDGQAVPEVGCGFDIALGDTLTYDPITGLTIAPPTNTPMTSNDPSTLPAGANEGDYGTFTDPNGGIVRYKFINGAWELDECKTGDDVVTPAGGAYVDANAPTPAEVNIANGGAPSPYVQGTPVSYTAPSGETFHYVVDANGDLVPTGVDDIVCRYPFRVNEFSTSTPVTITDADAVGDIKPLLSGTFTLTHETDIALTGGYHAFPDADLLFPELATLTQVFRIDGGAWVSGVYRDSVRNKNAQDEQHHPVDESRQGMAAGVHTFDFGVQVAQNTLPAGKAVSINQRKILVLRTSQEDCA